MITQKSPYTKSAWGSFFAQNFLSDGKELDQEQDRDHVGQDGNFLALAGEQLDDGIGDQAQTDRMTDGTGDRHTNEHHSNRNDLVDVIEINVLKTHQHQDTDIDQSGRSSSRRDQSRDRSDEDAGQEQDTGGQSCKTCTAACLNTRSGFNEGGNGGSTGNSTSQSTDRIRDQSFLHVRHVAVFVDHTGTGSRTDQGTDGIEHIDHAERDDQGDSGKDTDIKESLEVELEERGFEHIAERRNKAGGSQGSKRVLFQEDRLSGPVNNGSAQHAQQNSAFDTLLSQKNDDEQTDKHSDDGKNHLRITAAHVRAGRSVNVAWQDFC